MNIKPTEKSLHLVQGIAQNVPTFHHHYHVLFDIATIFGQNPINYVEIGAYAGASSCLMLQRENTNIISIDLGHPIDKSDVLENIINYKTNGNNYKYLKGNSQSLEMQQQVIAELKKHLATHNDRIDILFIDGDHSREGVIADFYTYKELVATNGYIAFDDYQDAVHSPEVKIAVDEIVNTFITTPLQENKTIEYAIVGCLSNALKAHPSDLKEGNCFIIKKIR